MPSLILGSSNGKCDVPERRQDQREQHHWCGDARLEYAGWRGLGAAGGDCGDSGASGWQRQAAGVGGAAIPEGVRLAWDAREAARVEGGEIVMQGQPVCTEAYSAPLRFEFVVTLDQLVSDDGCLWIEFIPDGPDAELNVPPQSVAIQMGYHQRGEGSGMFTIAAAGARPEDSLGKSAFTVGAGEIIAYRDRGEAGWDTCGAERGGF